METAAADVVASVHFEALPLGHAVSTPWDFSPAWFLLLALALPALVWLGCAWKRALDEDPHRLRRRGKRELQRLLQQAGQHGGAPATAQLHAWMRATARTWGVTLAAPTLVQITREVELHAQDATQPSRWRELWSATERGLFAVEANPPGDWLREASSAAAEVRIPKRERWIPNRRHHWLPAIVLLALPLLGFAPGELAAQEPATDQVALPQAADLTEARVLAEQALATNWNDWAAHHNIAAFHIQKQNWNAAAAHATAAFLQRPGSAAGQDNLRFVLTQVQDPDPTLRRLLTGGWNERTTRWGSAAQWQGLALGASLLLAAALTLAVVGLYVPLHRPLIQAWRGGIVAGALVLALSVQAWSSYGRLADPRAGMLVLQAEVLPEPTDLTPREASSPAAAGTVVLTRRSFLSWQQIEAREDLTGWVRRAEVLPFYAEGSSL
jgi:hypothetical protein